MTPPVRWSAWFGQAGEARQLAQRHIHPEGAGAGAVAADPLAKIRRLDLGRDEGFEQELGMKVRDHGPRGQGLAGGGDHPRGPAVLRQDLGHRLADADFHAKPPAGGGHGLGDGAHAADGVAPGALVSVHLAEHMVQQHIGRARRIGRRIVADDAVEPEGGLDRRALEPAVQPIAGRLRKERQKVAPGGDIQLGEPAADAGALEKLADRAQHPAADRHVGRGLKHQIAHRIGDGLEPGVVFGEPRGVLLGELRHFLGGPAVTDDQIVARVQRQEIGHLALDDAQAVAGEVHVGDDLGIEQGDGVAGHRISEAGMEFLRHRRAADHAATLQYGDLQAGAGQIPGADEAIVAPADDNHVSCGFSHGQAALPSGRGDLASGIRSRSRSAKLAMHTSWGESGPVA